MSTKQKSKANARIKIHYQSARNGLKVYGKIRNVLPLEPGDSGRAEELTRISRECNPGKTHAFYPAKWNYEWCINVSDNDFEFYQQ